MRRTCRRYGLLLFLLTCAMLGGRAAPAQLKVRVKDLTDIAGWRANKLTGWGLVVGLNGTGGKNPATRQFVMNMLEKAGLRADPLQRLNVRNDTKEKTDNVSVVAVTGELPPFARRGQRFDVVVSTIDDATSLLGGQLILTPLIAVDGEVYAVADGRVSLGGGFSVGGQAANVQKNHPTSGRIPNGAIVEKEVCEPPPGRDGRVRLLLREADFETARRIAEAVNEEQPGIAAVVDPGTVELLVPIGQQANLSGFIAGIQAVRVSPDVAARVVINETTGTVVIGENVRLSKVAITHANLSVITGESPIVSQPAPFSQGQTTVVPRTDVDVTEESNPVSVIDETPTVGDLARALNALGVTPRDLSAIFQALKESGSLHAELEFK